MLLGHYKNTGILAPKMHYLEDLIYLKNVWSVHMEFLEERSLEKESCKSMLSIFESDTNCLDAFESL